MLAQQKWGCESVTKTQSPHQPTDWHREHSPTLGLPEGIPQLCKVTPGNWTVWSRLVWVSVCDCDIMEYVLSLTTKPTGVEVTYSLIISTILCYVATYVVISAYSYLLPKKTMLNNKSVQYYNWSPLSIVLVTHAKCVYTPDTVITLPKRWSFPRSYEDMGKNTTGRGCLLGQCGGCEVLDHWTWCWCQWWVVTESNFDVL